MAAGCDREGVAAEVEVPPGPPPEDVRVGSLTELLTTAGLGWLVLAQPQAIFGLAWLAEPLGKILRGERLSLLARATGVDLRAVPELALAGYDTPAGESVAFFVRHDSEALLLERMFRERLTSDASRSVHGHQLITVFGKLGTQHRGFVSVGPEVVGFQFDGDDKTGPARIATLYAEGRLADVPALAADAATHQTLSGLEPGLVTLLLPGPFDGVMAMGARGLMRAAEAVAASLAAAGEGVLRVSVQLVGDFRDTRGDTAPAVAALERAWGDVAQSDLGHLLHLHEPRTPPRFGAGDDRLALVVDVDATALIDGLAAATMEDVETIMQPNDGEVPP